MKKIISAISALIVCILTAGAATTGIEYQYTLVLNKTDGTKVEYMFESIPVAEIQGDDVKITLTTTLQSVLYPIAQITNFTFERATNGIDGIQADNRVSFGISDDVIEVAGLAPGTTVAVYDLAGSLRASGVCDAEGALTLTIGSLAKGVYVISAGNNSFKFIR